MHRDKADSFIAHDRGEDDDQYERGPESEGSQGVVQEHIAGGGKVSLARLLACIDHDPEEISCRHGLSIDLEDGRPHLWRARALLNHITMQLTVRRLGE